MPGKMKEQAELVEKWLMRLHQISIAVQLFTYPKYALDAFDPCAF